MAIYYRWIQSDSPDLKAALVDNRLVYTGTGGRASSKAFWIFRKDKPYRPSSSVVKGRLLVVFELTKRSEALLNDPQNHVDFEVPKFLGEAGYPAKIIVKNNELGAYGIGQAILRQILPSSPGIKLGTKEDVASALGKNVCEVQEQKRPVWLNEKRPGRQQQRNVNRKEQNRSNRNKRRNRLGAS